MNSKQSLLFPENINIIQEQISEESKISDKY